LRAGAAAKPQPKTKPKRAATAKRPAGGARAPNKPAPKR